MIKRIVMPDDALLGQLPGELPTFVNALASTPPAGGVGGEVGFGNLVEHQPGTTAKQLQVPRAVGYVQVALGVLVQRLPDVNVEAGARAGREAVHRVKGVRGVAYEH